MEENTPANNPDETPAETTAEAEAPVAPDVAEPTVARTPGPRLRDQVWSFRSMLAVGIASLLLGGVGGAGLVAATHGEGHRDRFSRFEGGRGGPGFGRYGGGNGYPGPGGFIAPQNGMQPGTNGSAPVPTSPSSPAG